MKIFISSVQKEFAAERKEIVNAVCHRDYASNACVQVMLFRDRLEIINPGYLPKGTTIQDLLVAHDSNPRNHLIARAMSWTNYVEKSGSGTGEIIRLCREAGLADPVFESLTGHFKTIIWRRGYGPNQGPESGARVKGTSQRDPVADPSRHPVGPQSAPSRGTQSALSRASLSNGPKSMGLSRRPKSHYNEQPIQVRVINALWCADLKSSELATAIGQQSLSGRLKLRIEEMLEDKVIAYTIPSKPRSRLQKYRLTAKGRKLAAKLVGRGDPRAPRKTKGGGR